MEPIEGAMELRFFDAKVKQQFEDQFRSVGHQLDKLQRHLDASFGSYSPNNRLESVTVYRHTFTCWSAGCHGAPNVSGNADASLIGVSGSIWAFISILFAIAKAFISHHQVTWRSCFSSLILSTINRCFHPPVTTRKKRLQTAESLCCARRDFLNATANHAAGSA